MAASSILAADATTPELAESVVRPVRGPPAGMAGDREAVTLQLVRDRDRIAGGMNHIVVRRLFSAGLALEMALELIGDHPGAGKVLEAIGGVDLAIRDIRNVLFDHNRHDPASREPPV
jgi:hypothetical protein